MKWHWAHVPCLVVTIACTSSALTPDQNIQDGTTPSISRDYTSHSCTPYPTRLLQILYPSLPCLPPRVVGPHHLCEHQAASACSPVASARHGAPSDLFQKQRKKLRRRKSGPWLLCLSARWISSHQSISLAQPPGSTNPGSSHRPSLDQPPPAARERKAEKRSSTGCLCIVLNLLWHGLEWPLERQFLASQAPQPSQGDLLG